MGSIELDVRSLEEAERYLDGFVNHERTVDFDYERFGTRRVAALLEAVGRPERGLPCVHIAGSKGKGSVALATEALLRASGLRVGTFTSPHLVSWCERFRVEGRAATEGELVAALRELLPAAERLRRDPELRPSFFDVTTVLGLLLFRRASVEVAVVEVGLGGRLDSTNRVESRVSVITSLQLEHTDKLGGTLGEIAGEKAGILKEGVPLVHGPLPADALSVVLGRAVALDVPVEEVRATDVELEPDRVRFRIPDGRRLTASVLGRHLATNVALAVSAAETFLGRRLEAEELSVLRALRLPARLERIGRAVLDSAHTPDSVRALRETLAEIDPGRRWVTLLAISKDKDAAGILQEIAPPTRRIILCRGDRHRSQDPERLEPLAWASGIEEVEVVPDAQKGLTRALEVLRADEQLVVAGSFYLAGMLRAVLSEMER
jgi:dihydrofolate synthase/folylpolyglutamate synthase